MWNYWDMPDHYTLLKIDPLTDQAGIEVAWNAFLQRLELYAPGIKPDIPGRFPEVWQAFSVLRDPVVRAEYDKSCLRKNAVGAEITAQTETDERGSLSRFRSGVVQVGFLLALLLCLYALVHFSAL
jgi:hypothetical protein